MDFIIGCGVIQGILIILFFLPIKKNRKANLWLMAMILLAICQMLLLTYLQFPFKTGGSLILKCLVRILVFPVPVCLFFYVSFLTGKKTELSVKDLWHTIPMTLVFIYLLFRYGTLFSSDNPWQQINERTFALEWFSFLIFQSLIIIAYGFLLLKNYRNYQAALENNFANLEGKQLHWLQGLTFGDFMIGTSGVLGGLLSFYAFANTGMNEEMISNATLLILVVVSICTFWITYKAIKVPELFRMIELKTTTIKYAHSSLQKSKNQGLGDKIVRLMTEEQLYLDPELTLGAFAKKLGYSNQILSQYLNQEFLQSFYDFVNSYRLEHAKSMLGNANYYNFTIEAIAKESGFKSKSTFYSFFKKKLGITPKQYIDQVKNTPK